MRRRSLQSILCVLLAVVAGAGALLAQPAAMRDFDQHVAKVLKTFDVPGVSVAVVKDGKVVLAKGYGVRKLGDATPVDARTLFAIASNSKAFTATAIGILVEEGKLEWDAPVVKYLPWFQLSDYYVTRELTIRDLLVHRSGIGLGGGDLLWWPPSTYDRKEIVRRLRSLPLATSFRSTYAYDNVLYTVAGEVIEAVSGMKWEEFITARIFARVGMGDSNPRHSDAGIGKNVASPHALVNGLVRVISPFASDNTNPAGGINSSAEDMAKWMIVQLDSGRVADGTRLFKPATARTLWSIVTPMPIGDPPPELESMRANFSGYALGLGVRDYRGKKILMHSGGLPGFVSRVIMVPEIKLGITVLTNQESEDGYAAIAYHVLDRYLEAPAFDWTSALKRAAARRDSLLQNDKSSIAVKRDSLSHPSLPLSSYAGIYTDAWYGDVEIALQEGKLTIRFVPTPSLKGILQHWQYDTFVARWDDPELRADAFVTFALKPDGTIEQAKMKAFSPATDFSFDFQDLLLKPAGKRARIE